MLRSCYLCRYKAVGIRLDSGDLAYLSCETRKFFCSIEKEFELPGFGKMSITASNDLNEETLDALNKQVNFTYIRILENYFLV
jgi:nicotinate phosphoribosyltransferase